MEKAFDLVAKLIQAWIGENPNNFPPIVNDYRTANRTIRRRRKSG